MLYIYTDIKRYKLSMKLAILLSDINYEYQNFGTFSKCVHKSVGVSTIMQYGRIMLLTFNGVSTSNEGHNIFMFEMIFSEISPHHLHIVFRLRCSCTGIPSSRQQHGVVAHRSTMPLSDRLRCTCTTFCVQTLLI